MKSAGTIKQRVRQMTYWLVVALFFCMVAAVILWLSEPALALSAPYRDSLINSLNSSIKISTTKSIAVWKLMAGVFAFIGIVGYRQLEANEIGFVSLLGIPMQKVIHGPHFEIPLLARIRTFPALTYELVMQTGIAGIISNNLHRIATDFRVAFGTKNSGNTKPGHGDPLELSITCDPRVAIRWRIVDAEMFFRRVGSVERAMDLLAQTVSAALQSIAGTMSLAEALEKQGVLEEHILKQIEIMIGERPKNDKTGERNPDWGIVVDTASIEDFGIPHSVNISRAGRASVAYEADQTRTRADATRYELEQKGTGMAAAKYAMLEKEAAGLRKLAEAAGDENARFMAEQETVRQTLGGPNGPNVNLFAMPQGEGRRDGLATALSGSVTAAASGMVSRSATARRSAATRKAEETKKQATTTPAKSADGDKTPSK
jgi:regulator of protease activity HflC (stomatin/prohibitin superfamily)